MRYTNDRETGLLQGTSAHSARDDGSAEGRTGNTFRPGTGDAHNATRQAAGRVPDPPAADLAGPEIREG
jgi:hypothetical protein